MEMPYCVGDEIQRVCEKTGENWSLMWSEITVIE